jgi:hypothetical protein
MFMTLITFLSALSISVIAIYYSVAGLAAIFAAAVVPIVVMGVALEIGKLVTAVWLHRYWSIAAWWLKTYLAVAVFVLMFITSMGIFGFLSKAHLDQTLVGSDAQASIVVYDERIRNQRTIIEANQKLIQQLDDVVNQTMSRTTAQSGAERALQIRRSQAADRKRLVDEIAAAQKEIASINEQRAPIAANIRKIEAEVGPIKYIAEFIYGDRANENMLEEAVRWVIVILIFVFDPLAVLLLIASQYTWDYHKAEKKRRQEEESEKEMASDLYELNLKQEPTVTTSPWPFPVKETQNELVQTQTPQVNTAKEPAEEAEPDVREVVERDPEPPRVENPVAQQEESPVDTELKKKPLKSLELSNSEILSEDELRRSAEYDAKELDSEFQNSKTSWKAAHPDQTLKMYKTLYIKGKIDRLPWEEEIGYKQNSEQDENTLFNKLRRDK